MQIQEGDVLERENLAVIYSCLGSISDRGREYLKNTAQFLIALQNRQGTPIPDSISNEIIQNSP
jgi:hypothetical protein